MMIQVLLSLMLMGVGVYGMMQTHVWWPLRTLLFAAIAAGFFFVWFPEWTNAVAHIMGVGRGADLLIYIWIVLSLAISLFLYLRIIRLHKDFTDLVRFLAVERPLFPSPSASEPDAPRPPESTSA